MPIEITTVSGYSAFGKNMTAVKYGDDVVIIDMGIQPENYIRFVEDQEDVEHISVKELVKAGAIPDVSSVDDWKGKVRAIVPGHAHLDHCGAIVYLANKFNAPIIATPFTAEVLRTMFRDRKVTPPLIQEVAPNSSFQISDQLSVEMINVTHSTPQSSIVALHTPEGAVLYAADFKFDMSPTLGKPPNIKRLHELGDAGIAALIIEATYGDLPGRTPSEAIAQDMLRDAVNEADLGDNAIIITTFSSHIARLKSTLAIAQKHNRKVIFMGRSMARYAAAAEKVGLVDFSKKAEIVKFGKKVERRLIEIRDSKGKYLLVCTGHQGEPQSVLSRIISKDFLDPKDFVIFSCKTIPTPTNIENRARLERELKRMGLRILTDVHQSGHGSQDELMELIDMVKPRHVLPSHGDSGAKLALAAEIEKRTTATVHIAKDGDRFTF